MNVVCNASPLIYLSKLGRLDLLHDLFKKILIPEQVWQEVVIQGKKDFPVEAGRVEQASNQGWLFCETIPSNSRFPEIHAGEAAVIELALKKKIKVVLMDDAAGRQIAENSGLQVRGTLFVLLESCKTGTLSKKQCEELLNNLIQSGFRVRTEVYAQCWNYLHTL
ncbi:MAG: DUF3368 domain-containing protein, partial [Candidatus Woesearchaeota archaeon]|nr:DUF3368 domain-containing protein [Candidatus Woesearchaeota archaeon]